jgi:hypothetical protein
MPTIDERCWDGYEPVPGKEPYSDDSCRPEKGKGKGKAEGDGVPDKVKEIADAIKRDNPGISDEKKMRIAWSTYKKMGKGKDAAGMGSGYGSPSDIGVTGMIPYPAEQTCSSLIERLQEERTDSQQNVLTEGFVSKLARAIKVRYKDFPEERKVLLDGIMKGLRGKLPKGYKPVLDRNYGGITIHYGKMGLPVGVAFGSKKKEIFAEVTTPHGDLAYPEFSNSWIEDPQPAIGWAVKVLTNGTQNYAALAVDYPHMLGEKAEEIITEVETYSPPQGARNNAKKVLKWKEEHGNEVKAMTQTGWTRANQLVPPASTCLWRL